MVIKIDTKTKTKRFLAQRPIWRLKLRLVEWIWPKKSHKTKNIVFDLYRGHGSISLAYEAGHCSNLKIVPDLASLARFKFFQWFLCIIFNPLSPPHANFDFKIFHLLIFFVLKVSVWNWLVFPTSLAYLEYYTYLVMAVTTLVGGVVGSWYIFDSTGMSSDEVIEHFRKRRY